MHHALRATDSMIQIQVPHLKSSHCFSETGTSSCTESASGTTSCFNVNLSPDATTANQVGAFNVVSAQAERKPAAFFRPELASHGGCSVAVRVLRLLLLLPWLPPLSAQEAVFLRISLGFAFWCVERAHSGLLLLSDTAGWKLACCPAVLAVCVLSLNWWLRSIRKS